VVAHGVDAEKLALVTQHRDLRSAHTAMSGAPVLSRRTAPSPCPPPAAPRPAQPSHPSPPRTPLAQRAHKANTRKDTHARTHTRTQTHRTRARTHARTHTHRTAPEVGVDARTLRQTVADAVPTRVGHVRAFFFLCPLPHQRHPMNRFVFDNDLILSENRETHVTLGLFQLKIRQG